jgi:hypothetical protein
MRPCGATLILHDQERIKHDSWPLGANRLAAVRRAQPSRDQRETYCRRWSLASSCSSYCCCFSSMRLRSLRICSSMLAIEDPLCLLSVVFLVRELLISEVLSS